MWVRQRIVPPDRQNIGQILKANGLEEYDEFSLLMLGSGRCAQDDYYLFPLSEEEVEETFRERYQKRIEDVVSLKNGELLAFFRNGKLKKVDIPLTLEDFRKYISSRVVNTAEVVELLECSRQNVNDLVKRKKLVPVKKNQKNTLFLKSEVLQRKWN